MTPCFGRPRLSRSLEAGHLEGHLKGSRPFECQQVVWKASAQQVTGGQPMWGGYKARLAAGSNSFAFDIFVYQGKDGSKERSDASFGLGGEVVLGVSDVMQKYYPTKKLSIYCEKFFIPLKLSERAQSMHGSRRCGHTERKPVKKCTFSNCTKLMKLHRGSPEHFVMPSQLHHAGTMTALLVLHRVNVVRRRW